MRCALARFAAVVCRTVHVDGPLDGQVDAVVDLNLQRFVDFEIEMTDRCFGLEMLVVVRAVVSSQLREPSTGRLGYLPRFEDYPSFELAYRGAQRML